MKLHIYSFVVLIFFLSISKVNGMTKFNNHLVVLSHGVFGKDTDLNYLAGMLAGKGFQILKSKANRHLNSLFGIRNGGIQLANEIIEYHNNHPELREISFVGNSLGGLFTRYAVKELFSSDDNSIHGLIPMNFMTIATPHLGISNYTFLEEYNLPKYLDFLKVLTSKFLFQTGGELFGFDHNNLSETLIYQMSTNSEYLIPIRNFRKRRLYANLINDFVVHLHTAAFLTKEEGDHFRRIHNQKNGIVQIIQTESKTIDNLCTEPTYSFNDMINSLNSLGWEKILVSFPGLLPSAHNKIAAVTKYTPFIDSLLGYSEGRYAMDHAVEWFLL